MKERFDSPNTDPAETDNSMNIDYQNSTVAALLCVPVVEYTDKELSIIIPINADGNIASAEETTVTSISVPLYSDEGKKDKSKSKKKKQSLSKQIASTAGSGEISPQIRVFFDRLFTYDPSKPTEEREKIAVLTTLFKQGEITQEQNGSYTYPALPSVPSAIVGKQLRAGQRIQEYIDYYLHKITTETLDQEEQVVLENEYSLLPIFLQYRSIAFGMNTTIPGLQEASLKNLKAAQENNSISLVQFSQIKEDEYGGNAPTVFRDKKAAARLEEQINALFAQAIPTIFTIQKLKENKKFMETVTGIKEQIQYLASMDNFSGMLKACAATLFLRRLVEQMGETGEKYIEIVQQYLTIRDTELDKFTETIDGYLDIDPFTEIPEGFPSVSQLAALPTPLSDEARQLIAPIFTLPETSDFPAIHTLYLQLATSFGENVAETFAATEVDKNLPKHYFYVLRDAAKRLREYVSWKRFQETDDNPNTSFIPLLTAIDKLLASGTQGLLPKVIKPYIPHFSPQPLTELASGTLYQAAVDNFTWRSTNGPFIQRDPTGRNLYEILNATDEEQAERYLDQLNSLSKSPEKSVDAFRNVTNQFPSILKFIKRQKEIILTQLIEAQDDMAICALPTAELYNVFLFSSDNQTALVLQWQKDGLITTFPSLEKWDENVLFSIAERIEAICLSEHIEGKAGNVITAAKVNPILNLPYTNPAERKEIVALPPKEKTRGIPSQEPIEPEESKPTNVIEKKATIIFSTEDLDQLPIPQKQKDLIKEAITKAEIYGVEGEKRYAQVVPYVGSHTKSRIRVGKYRVVLTKDKNPHTFTAEFAKNKSKMNTVNKMNAIFKH